jgi:hypothetical protein
MIFSFKTIIDDIFIVAEIYEDEYIPENKRFIEVFIRRVSRRLVCDNEKKEYTDRELEKMVLKQYEKEKLEWK